MRAQVSRQRLVLVIGILGAAAAAICWGRGGSQATAEPTQISPPPQAASTDPPVSNSDYAQRVVAYIYDTVPLTREQFGEYLIARQGEDRIQNFVNRRIIEHVCQQQGVEVTAAEIEADFAETLKGLNNLPIKDFVNRLLKPYNKSLYEWKEDVVRPRLLLTKLCRDRVQVTPEDLKTAFDANYGPKVECRMIMWPHSEQKQVMATIYGKIRESEREFDHAATHQASAQLAASGGRIRPIGRNTTGNKELEDAAFALRPGELSRVLSTPEGLVVIKCDKHLPADTSKKLQTEREGLTKEVFDKKLQAEIPKFFNELKEKANPKVLFSGKTTESQLLRDVRGELQSGRESIPR